MLRGWLGTILARKDISRIPCNWAESRPFSDTKANRGQPRVHHEIEITMKAFLPAFAAFLLLSGCGKGGISPAVARSHIGENATVRGRVTQVSASRRGTAFMNMGGSYPNQQFTAVAFHIPYATLAPYEGKTVSVSGTIKDYKGKPEIILNSLSQISE